MGALAVPSAGPYALSPVAAGGGSGGQAVPGPRWVPSLLLRVAGVPAETLLCNRLPAQALPRSGPPTLLRCPKLRDPRQRGRWGPGAAGDIPERGHIGQSGQRLAGGRKADGGGGGRRRAGRGPSLLPPCAPPATLPLLGRGRRRRQRERRRRRRRRDLEFPSAAAAAAAAAAPRLQARPPPEAPVALGGRGCGASRRPGFGNFPAATRGAGAGSRAERR